MNPYRSGRAWLPAAMVSVVFTATLGVLQVIFRETYDESVIPTGLEDSTLEWLFATNLGFWGPDAFDTDEARVIIASVVGALVLLVVTFLVAWPTLRGMAPGSSAFPAFIGTWLATMVATPVAAVAIVLVNNYDRLGDEAPLWAPLSGAISNSVYGFKWGWLAALIGTFVWIVVRPKPSPAGAAAPTPPEPDSAGDPDQPEPPTALPPPPTPRPAPPI
jgi:hypothetical protein